MTACGQPTESGHSRFTAGSNRREFEIQAGHDAFVRPVASLRASSRRPVAFDMTMRHNAPMAAQNRIRARRQSAIVSPAAPEMPSSRKIIIFPPS